MTEGRSRYEAWINIKAAEGDEPTKFAPTWFVLAFAICLGITAIGLTVLRAVEIEGRPAGFVSVVVASLGVIGIGLLAIRTWLVATERVHRFLLGHPEWSDGRRLSILTLTFIGLPVCVGALVFGILAGIDGMTR